MKKYNAILFCVGAWTAVLLCFVLVGCFWPPYDTAAMDAQAKFQPPSLRHLMGTDNFGRDIFSRVLEGAASSLLIALCVVAIGGSCGLVIGALCGYYGGIADAVLTRVCDSITAFPSFLLALVIISVAGQGTYNIILALGILFIPSFARIVRTEFVRCRDLNYIQSARLMGAGDGRIMLLHILPNTLTVLLSSVTIGFNNAILSEASMSFLGLGIQPPMASLGSMLSDSRVYLKSAPWYALWVGGVIAALVLGVGLCLCLVRANYVLGTVIGLVGVVMLLGLIPMVKGLK